MTSKIRQSCTLLIVLGLAITATPASAEGAPITPLAKNADLEIKSAQVTHNQDLNLLIFEQEVRGTAGGTTPEASGAMDGAPVLGYVFPTTLEPAAIGFDADDGIVALAVTSHPDFDDTPLWDENGDRDYANDGRVFHTHWVLLGPDDRVAGGLAVIEFEKEEGSVVLPPTNPGMPMYMDSPGFAINTRGPLLQVLVPAARLRGSTSFKYDAVSAYMQVNTSDLERPLLGVYSVYSILSDDLSLPYSVRKK